MPYLKDLGEDPDSVHFRGRGLVLEVGLYSPK
jgi:hypothetical protein